jgi:hypothetical protein
VSIAVALDELRSEIAKRGDAAFLVTTNGSSPHIVSVRVSWDGDTITAGAGNTTAKNVGERPVLSLLWPSTFDDYSLIVDGSASIDADVVRIAPTRAVLHRSVAASGDGPGCVTIV